MTKSVLIFESDVTKCELLRRRSERSGTFADVYTANTDEIALDIIKNIKPFLLISDVIPKYGSYPLNVIAEYKKTVPCGRMICVTSCPDIKVAAYAYKIGFESYLLEPVSQSVINRKLLAIPGMLELDELSRLHHFDTESNDSAYSYAENFVTTKLLSLGFAANMHGFGYIRDAIMLRYRAVTSNVQSEIYEVIAEKHDVSTSSVERNIRHAIASAYINGNAEKIEAFLGNPANPKKGKPTNSAFIAHFYEAMRISMNE